ncbi:MAG: VacJ family lipoprotein [Betaproteobacteria bacterium]|nr:VacJ family lipoprotein [Betaproteobacteria bacterium]
MRLRAFVACGVVFLALLGGCASTGNPRDPLEPINRGIYHFNDGVDTVLLKPAAEVYRGALPQFIRTGVHNFFSNINDVIVALNNLLQAKFLNAASDVGRIVVNTTVGVLGVLDIATELGLEKHNEDFGQTLGFWGIGDGPYLVLPILGPSNVRDAFGTLVDFKTDPLTYVDPTRDRNVLWGVRAVNRRAELLDTTSILETAALDPYEFLRDAYLQRRRNLVHDGSPPPEQDEDVDIKMKPRSERPDSGPFPTGEHAPGPGAILVGGDPDSLTPARIETLEKAARTAARMEPATRSSAAREERANRTQNPRVMRFWTPVSSSR